MKKQLVSLLCTTAVCTSHLNADMAASAEIMAKIEAMQSMLDQQSQQITELQAELDMQKSKNASVERTVAYNREQIETRFEGVPAADKSELDVQFSGFAKIDYGAGNRYKDKYGDDRYGISKYAFKAKAKYENFTFVSILGGKELTNGKSEDIAIREAYVVWDKVGGSDFSISAGPQPLLFGLKPNGFAGDRSIVKSIEFGGAGGFAVANQINPALIVSHPLMDVGQVRAGVFDSSETFKSGKAEDGSTIWKNGFLQFELENIGIEGLYGIAGVEGRYSGTTDDTELIYDVGIGFKTDALGIPMDISFEYIALSEAVAGTTDDENYYIVEFTAEPFKYTYVNLDWAKGDELGAQTVRAEVEYKLNKYTKLSAGYARDFLDGKEDLNSFDTRITFKYK